MEEHKSRSNFCHISYAFIARTVGECKKVRDDRKSDFSISWMSLQDAAAVMDKALKMCKEYSMMFMLKREKVILDYALKQIEEGEISINDWFLNKFDKIFPVKSENLFKNTKVFAFPAEYNI